MLVPASRTWEGDFRTVMSLRFKHLDDNSASSSRSVSRTRSPVPESEENGQLDYNFNNLEEILAIKLEAYENMIDNQDKKQTTANELNRERITSKSTTIVDIIESLHIARTGVSTQSRELLLAQLYKLIVTKPLVVYNEHNAGTSQYVGEQSVQDLLYLLMKDDFKTSQEFMLLYRSVVSLIVSDIENFSSLVDGAFLAFIRNLIVKPSNSIITNENKSYVITGYVSMLLMLYNGSTSFGIDDIISWLLEITEGYCLSSLTAIKEFKEGDREYSTFFDDLSEQRLVDDLVLKQNSESLVGISGLHGIGVLLTLIPRNEYLNEIIADMVPKLIDLLDEDNLELTKAAGRLIGLCYEIYTYDDSNQDSIDETEYNYNSPYYEQEEIIADFTRLANLNTKKLKKTHKKDTHTIFRDILNSVKVFSDSKSRLEVYKKSPTGLEILNNMMNSNYLKLSRTKSIQINSWFLYLRLIHLKWCFSFGVHSQLVANETVRDILREPPSVYQEKYGDEPEDAADSRFYTERRELDDKTRSKVVRKARIDKLDEQVRNTLS